MKIEDLHYDLTSHSIDEENWDLKKWRKENPMDYLKALYILLNIANNDIVQAEVFKAIYRVTRLYIPDVLYKYYSLSADKELNEKKFQTLSNGKIYMSDINDFNDPYDSKGFFYNPVHLSNIERLKAHKGKIIDDFSTFIRATALTENDVQSMPMWAHYANNHMGFCIAYDMNDNIPLSSCTFPVQYINERLDITSIMFQQAQQISNKIDRNIEIGETKTVINDLTMVFVPCLLYNLKLDAWSYEKEFRCTTAATSKGMPFIDAKPTTIYIGMHCSDEHTNRLVQIGKSLLIPVYKMRLDQYCSDYKLTTQQLT